MTAILHNPIDGAIHLKAFFTTFIACYLVLNPAEGKEITQPIKSEAAILINAENGKILYQKNAQQKRHPASITKILTFLHTLNQKKDSLDETVIIRPEAVAIINLDRQNKEDFPAYILEDDGVTLGFKAGERTTIKDLCYCLMLPSANDAANVLAQHLGNGSINTCMNDINSWLKKMDINDSHFMNPHGLTHPQHTTTAHDMAQITAHALEFPEFRKLISTVHHKRSSGNGAENRLTLRQTNRLIKEGKQHYTHAIGGKTGYTFQSQNTFVGIAEKEGRTLIGVFLTCDERTEIFNDAIALFSKAFDEKIQIKTFLQKGKQPYTHRLKGGASPASTYTNSDVSYHYYPAEEEEVKCTLQWKTERAPVEAGDKLGSVILSTVDGEVLQEVDLLASEAVSVTLWAKLPISKVLAFAVVIGLLATFAAQMKRRR
jgi:D-alanyl-D-alanine carboxypeptidase (penicillin-binding protein 5/6)